ncbi:hypothetical protein [Bradyrhizobium sp.]|uniref:hypothetical protein n=1 Tax=Bradyrhizobium sp. TaxID=376 RepID=UPI003C42EB2F
MIADLLNGEAAVALENGQDLAVEFIEHLDLSVAGCGKTFPLRCNIPQYYCMRSGRASKNIRHAMLWKKAAKVGDVSAATGSRRTKGRPTARVLYNQGRADTEARAHSPLQADAPIQKRQRRRENV